MKTYMPLNGLRWSRNSGSANCDMPQSAVFGRPGGKGYLNEGSFPPKTFAGAHAKLCVSNCKALRGQMQSFAWADAKLCVKKGLIVDEIDDSLADKGFP